MDSPHHGTVAVVGATGTLGGLVSDALSARPGVTVRTLVRPGSADKGRRLSAKGFDVIEGTLDDPDALAELVEGADAVVSAAQGGPEVIVDGQRRLLAAAREAGVRRLVPSDYSVDFFRLPEGAVTFSDWRRRFSEVAEAERGDVEVVHVLNGCFADRPVLLGFLGAIDLDAGEIRVWGDGREPMDFTTYADTARYTAEVLLDPEPLPRAFGVAGDVLDVAGLVGAVERGSGQRLTVRTQGSLGDLDAQIETLREENPGNLFAYLPLMYWRAMLSGAGKVRPQNDRYPTVRPLGVAEHLAQGDRARDAR